MFNTKVTKARGMMVVKDKGVVPMNIIVRFTSENGETLSLSDERDNMMFTVAYEDVEALIKETRKTAPQTKGEE